MRVFVTGGSGFVGSAVVAELLSHGHSVLALARSEESIAKLKAAGAEVHGGSLEDHDSLKAGARACDGVIHLAFIHDFSNYDNSAMVDRAAVETLAGALEESGKPLVVTSGTLGVAGSSGKVATEGDSGDASATGRLLTERIALSYAARGVRSIVVRLPPTVHGDHDWGFVPWIIKAAREAGESGYIDDGQARWSAVHRLDAARLFCLALENGEAGSIFHGVAEEGVAIKEIADVIGRRLSYPVVSLSKEEAGKRYGFLAQIMQWDSPTTSAKTQEKLSWNPTGPKLLQDLEEGTYFEGA